MRENPSEKKMSLKEYWKSVLESWSETKCSKKVYQWLDLETAELQNHVLHFKYWATVKFPPKSVSRNSNYFSDFRLSPPKVGKINYINPIFKWRNSELYDSVDKYYIENLGKHLCALESLSPIPLYYHSQLLGLMLTMFSWVSISIFFSYSLHHSLCHPYEIMNLLESDPTTLKVNTFKDSQNVTQPKTRNTILSLPLVFSACSHYWDI